MPAPVLDGWLSLQPAGSASALDGGYAWRGRVLRDGTAVAEVHLSRTADGRLRDTYPVGERDLELRVEVTAPGDLPAVLAEVTPAVFAADPACRRVVVAVPAGDLETLGAVEDGGYRYVVDVQTLAGDELSLLVAERGQHRDGEV